MIRFWLGSFLLAASWLMGTAFYYPPRWPVWIALVSTGTLLFCWWLSGKQDLPKPEPDALASEPSTIPPRHRLVPQLAIVGFLMPAVVFAPWPHRMAPLLLAAGAMLAIPAWGWPRLRGLARGTLLAGVLLLIQDLALLAYQHGTARSHELLWPFPTLVLGVARLLGLEAALEQTNLMLSTMRQTHALGATWELFLDPPTACYLASSLLVLLFALCTAPPSRPAIAQPTSTKAVALAKRHRGPSAGLPTPMLEQWRRLRPLRPLTIWLVLTLLWLLLRSGLLLGWYLHRALRTDYDAPLALVNQFWNPWLQVLLLLPLVFLHANWLGACLPASPGRLFSPLPRCQKSALLPVAFTAVASLLLTLGMAWDPIGNRKGGRVAVDEYHSKWEPTDKPFDTEWYGHLSGYNYACIYDYCSRFYAMSRLTNALTDATLADLDVLIVKVPTERFAREDIEAVVRFVDRGGGLLLIGEHTDVFGTGHNLNLLAHRFGFGFRYDCLFGIPSFFDQYYTPSFVPHPVVQHLRGMDFATSCSIEPRGGSGRGVVTSTGLKNALADYHVSNYYPQAVDQAAMRYGAFVQLWATRHGAGRVLGFTDSTIFSNFCTFEPGKAELMLGMIEWLNHQDRLGSPRLPLLLLGSLVLGLALFHIRMQPAIWLPSVAAAAFVWTLACLSLVHTQLARLPPPLPQRPFTRVTIDRTACDGPLSKNGFIEGKTNGFGIFERWILRLGYFTRRASGPSAPSGDLTVFCYPTQPVSGPYLQALTRYVESGGRVLVLDSPENKQSTANRLLEPFGLAQRARQRGGGSISGPDGFPPITVESAHEIRGGQPLFLLGDTPVAATARQGQGSVTIIGFGARFTDTQMGVTGDVVPTDDLRKVFEFEYALLRGLVQNTIPDSTRPTN